MSSAVPIHPLTRIVRQQLSGSRALAVRPNRGFASTHALRYAAARNRSQDAQTVSASGPSASSASQSSASSASTSSASAQDSSAAARAYAISSRKRLNAQPGVKTANQTTPSAAAQSVERLKQQDAQPEVTSNGQGPTVEGGAQKMLSAEASPTVIDVPVKDKKPKVGSGKAAKAEGVEKRRDTTQSADTPKSTAKDEVITDGIIVSNKHSTSTQGSSQNFPFSSAFAESRRNPSSQSETDGNDGGESDAPARTDQSSSVNNDQIQRHLVLYPFNTHDFIKRLQNAGFLSEARVDSSKQSTQSTETALSANKRHDPAEAIMDSLQGMLVSRGQHVVDSNVNKTEVENQAYLFTAALAELRTELQVMARNDAAALRSMVTLLQREVDGLNQRMREDVAGMKHDIQGDMNNRKGEAKEEQNALDQEIQDLNNRFTISISDLKTEIEQSIKWDATRRALTVFFGCIVILIATLTAADYLTRDDVEHAHGGHKAGAHGHDEHAEPKTKSAEELGVVANYDEEHGSRYV